MGYFDQITQRGTPLDGGKSAQQRWDEFQDLYRTNKAQRDKKEAAQYSLAGENGAFFDPNGIPGINPMRNQTPWFGSSNWQDRRDQEAVSGYGSLWGGMKNFGSGVLDKVGEWAGNQGATEWAKIGLGIKDQFFDRPKMIDSYLKQGSSLNALRGSQMAAIDENIAGAKRAEARTTAMQLRNLNAQRPQGTPEFTQLTPSTYV